MKDNFESLVLLEFLVNEIKLLDGESILDKQFLATLGDTCVQISIHDDLLVEICEDDRCDRRRNDETGNLSLKFVSGKSCLFSLNKLRNSGCGCYEACICVMRKMPEGDAKDYFMYGKTSVNLESIFKSLLKSGDCGSASRSLKGVYDLKDLGCEKVGSVDLYVRGSGLGKTVITKFHLGAKDTSFYFKGTDENLEDESTDESSSEFMVKQSEYSGFPYQGEYAPSPHFTPYNLQMPPNMPLGNMQFGNMQFGNPQLGNMAGMQQMGFNTGVRGPTSKGDSARRGSSPCAKESKRGSRCNRPSFKNRPPPNMSPMGQAQQGMMPQQGMFPQPGMFLPPGMSPQPGMMFPGQGMASAPGQMSPLASLAPGQMAPYVPPFKEEDYEKLDGDYKEISAEVNGYEIKIKVLRRAKKEEA